MARKNILTTSPPYAVEHALDRLGANLRIARLRRNLTIDDAAAKIGTGPRAVRDAEKGKPGASAAVYFALLWAYNLLEPVNALGDPASDEEGLVLSRDRGRVRARRKRDLDNDF